MRQEVDDDIGAMWRELKAERQQKRAGNRISSAQMLRDAGIKFEAKNNGAHLIVKSDDGRVVDFWPGTGLWCVRPMSVQYRGVARLIKLCATKPR